MSELLTLTVLRKKLGMSQTSLAERTGISQPEISQYENGVLNLSVRRAHRIFDALVASEEAKLLPDGLTSDDLTKPWDQVMLRLREGVEPLAGGRG